MAEKSATFFIFVNVVVYLFGEDMAENPNTIKTPTLYVLPADSKDLQNFSKQFKVDMMEQVVGTIEFAVEHNLPLIEVFQFKNSDFVITLSEKDYLTNLDNIYSYYMKNEVYEGCHRVIKLQKTLKEKSVKTNDENKTHRPK